MSTYLGDGHSSAAFLNLAAFLRFLLLGLGIRDQISHVVVVQVVEHVVVA